MKHQHRWNLPNEQKRIEKTRDFRRRWNGKRALSWLCDAHRRARRAWRMWLDGAPLELLTYTGPEEEGNE